MNNWLIKSVVWTVATISMFSCTAQTRIGQLIPHHSLSMNKSGELVTSGHVQLEKLSEPKPKVVEPQGANPPIPGSAAMGTALAGLLANVAVDAVKKELQKEANNYEHQFSSRLLLTTDEIGSDSVLYFIRWIDAKNASKAVLNNFSADRGASVFASLSNVTDRKKDSVQQKLAVELGRRTGKVPAMILIMRMKEEVPGSYVYRMKDARLWTGAVGAKVVDFDLKNSWKVWQWLGALIMKTDSQATIDAQLSTKALTASKLSKEEEVLEAKWTEINPESSPLSAVNLDMDELPGTSDLSDNIGTWIAVPAYNIKGISRRVGFLVFEYKVTEKDASNAKKYIENAVESVEQQRGPAKSWLSGVFGAD